MLLLLVAVFIISSVSGNLVSVSSKQFTNSNPFFPNGRIVGGQPAAIENHPYQVSVQSYGFHFCGGSIISKDIILTAAHCTTSYPASYITVRVGTAKKYSGGALHQVEKIIRHSSYRMNGHGLPENDIAALRLKVPIAFGKTVQPVKSFDLNEESVEGVLSTISGWGSTREGGLTSEVLNAADVPIVSKKTCSEAYKNYGGVPEGQICAAYPDRDTCQGDSGGPMVISGRQAGIISWGLGCARLDYPGVYTEVAAFRDWLSKNVGV